MSAAAADPGRWLAILGLGEEGVEGLAAPARERLAAAELVAGGERHLALADGLIRGERLPWPHPISQAVPLLLARRGRPVAVLASGDPFCYGIGSLLARHVAAREMFVLPAPSAFSLACARLGWSLPETATLSFCGRPLEALAPHLQPGARILALSADGETPHRLAAYLRQSGFGPSRLHILEALGGPRERLRTSLASDDLPADIAALNLVGIEALSTPGARIIPRVAGLDDAFFEHDGQISKREIRALTLSALAPRAGDHLWDIGAGSGSVAIEFLLSHPSTSASAIERDAARSQRIARNAAALGVPRLHLVTGRAPAALRGLRPPDAIFIGGGAGEAGVIEQAFAALKPGGRIVANAVALETQARLVEIQKRYGGGLTRIGIERLDRLGSLHCLRPALGILQWQAVKP